MNKSTFEIDPATGLPRVPDNYYWEVYPYAYHFGPRLYRVMLVRTKKVWWVTRKWVEFHSDIRYTRDGDIHRDGAPLTPDNILFACELIMEKWETELKELMTENKLIGKYPPNKIS